MSAFGAVSNKTLANVSFEGKADISFWALADVRKAHYGLSLKNNIPKMR